MNLILLILKRKQILFLYFYFLIFHFLNYRILLALKQSDNYQFFEGIAKILNKKLPENDNYQYPLGVFA